MRPVLACALLLMLSAAAPSPPALSPLAFEQIAPAGSLKI